MKYPAILAAILAAMLCSCASHKTYTPAPSLDYARNGISDAKDYSNKVKGKSQEIDSEIQKLLDGTK